MQPDAIETVGQVNLAQVDGPVGAIRPCNPLEDAVEGSPELHRFRRCEGHGVLVHSKERIVADESSAPLRLWHHPQGTDTESGVLVEEERSGEDGPVTLEDHVRELLPKEGCVVACGLVTASSDGLVQVFGRPRRGPDGGSCAVGPEVVQELRRWMWDGSNVSVEVGVVVTSSVGELFPGA